MNNVIYFLTGALLFILPIPHTIAIRNILALLLLLVTVYMVVKHKSYKDFTMEPALKRVLILLGVLTLWIYFVAFFISDETHWSLGEIKSQWLTPLLYFATFAMLGVYATSRKAETWKNIYALLFLMLFVHVLYIDLYELQYYVMHKSIITRVSGLTEGPAADKANYITNVLLSFILAEVIYRFRVGKKLLNVSHFVLILILILTLMSSAFEAMRNGVIAIIFLGITSIIFAFYGNKRFAKKTKWLISLAILVSIAIPAAYNLKHDSRWATLKETIPIALDTAHHKAWMDHRRYPYPKLSNGQMVSGSNYERVAWMYEGSKLILEHPFGAGYGRNIFGHMIEKKYHEKKRTVGHSHSGLIDMGIGVGIPGIVLWLAFGIYLMYLASSYFFRYDSYFAIIVFFNVSGFFSRFLVDSNMRDHMFLTFMAILGFSLIAMFKEKEMYETDHLHSRQ